MAGGSPKVGRQAIAFVSRSSTTLLGATRMFSWLPLRAGSWHDWGGQQTILRLDPDGSLRGAAEEATELELMSIGAGNERAASVIRGLADLR